MGFQRIFVVFNVQLGITPSMELVTARSALLACTLSLEVALAHFVRRERIVLLPVVVNVRSVKQVK